MRLQQTDVAEAVQSEGKVFGGSHNPGRREVRTSVHGLLKLRHAAHQGPGEHLHTTEVKDQSCAATDLNSITWMCLYPELIL